MASAVSQGQDARELRIEKERKGFSVRCQMRKSQKVKVNQVLVDRTISVISLDEPASALRSTK